MISNPDSPGRKNLVFTSAGDHANLECWLGEDRDFDLWIVYYGNETDRYRDLGDFYLSRKGGKFPNLHHVYQHWEDHLKHYQAILVMDDDIIIDAAGINRLFQIRERHDLWLLQPAFDPRGKISHRITRVKPFTRLRFTNFVEVTCPLFRRDKLDEFMKTYEPGLVGWGIDLWFSDLFSIDNRKTAVVDEVTCINPLDRAKGGQREIDLLESQAARKKNWERIQEEHGIEERSPEVFGHIKRPPVLSSSVAAVRIIAVPAYGRFLKVAAGLRPNRRM